MYTWLGPIVETESNMEVDFMCWKKAGWDLNWKEDSVCIYIYLADSGMPPFFFSIVRKGWKSRGWSSRVIILLFFSAYIYVFYFPFVSEVYLFGRSLPVVFFFFPLYLPTFLACLLVSFKVYFSLKSFFLFSIFSFWKSVIWLGLLNLA